MGEQQGLTAHASRGQCGFSSRMATADDNHVKAVGVIQETPRLVPVGTDDVANAVDSRRSHLRSMSRQV